MGLRTRKKVYSVKYSIDMAIDAGNGTTCVVTERSEPIIFPSVIQRVEDVRLGGHGTQGFTIHVERMNAKTKKWQDRKSFAVGETANLLPGLKTRITSKDRIGSEYQLVLILAGTVRALNDIIESDAQEIKAFSRRLGHVPLIDPNPRRGEKRELDPAAQRRFCERTSVERVNSNLKDNFGGTFVRVRGALKVMCHLMFGLVALTATQLFHLLE